MSLILYYERLFELAEKQKECIDNCNYDQLIKIISQKQKVIEEINKIKIEEFLRQQTNPQQTIKQLIEIIKKIKNLENNNVISLKRKREELREDILDFQKKQKSRLGYQQAATFRESKFIDKKG